MLWIRRAADRNHPEALLMLGLGYAGGRGVPKNPEQALELMEKAAAAGSIEAQVELVRAYYGGLRPGTPLDREKAAEHAKVCAKREIAVCQSVLGLALMTEAPGVPRDVPEGIRWLRLAADQGEPRALGKLAEARLNGVGVPQDLEKAERLALESLHRGLQRAGARVDAIERARRPGVRR